MLKRVMATFSLVVLANSVLAQCQLTVQVSNFPPYALEDAQGKFSGLDIELVNALIKETDCQLIPRKLPWKRALHLLAHGGLDIMTGMSITVERQQYTTFIGPMRNESIILVVNSNSNLPIKSLDDLKTLPKPVGITRGSFYGVDFAKKFSGDPSFAANIDVSNNSITKFNNLLNGRLSGVIGDRFNMISLLKKRNLSAAYKIHPFTIHKSPVYFGFSKKALPAELLFRLQAANKRLLESGGYQHIIDKFSE